MDNILNLVFLTDTHVRATTPSSRLDQDYLSSCLYEIEYVLAYAKKVGAKAVLHGGDFFDSPDQSVKVVIGTAGLLMQYGLPVHTVLGQHDCVRRNQESYKSSSALGLLEKMGLVTVFSEAFEHTVEVIHGVTVAGMSYDDSNTRMLVAGYDISVAADIILLHAPVSIKPGYGVVDVRDLNLRSGATVLCGDIHDFVGEWGKSPTFVGTGAVSRKSFADVGREPQFLHVEVHIKSDAKKVVYKRVLIPQPKDDMLFRLNEKRLESLQQAQEFSAALERMRVVASESPAEMVERVGRAAGFSENAIEKVIQTTR